ncbi:hypothetical protein ACJMK2_016471 [Sinanodonta woodiana]|uniref:Leucine zipper transcription factor-like protein 1 n=1 Tax=Sinanodonta woodiana TaxID=1069815 RepID=A0ABD3UX92_SINWO
MKRAIYLHAQTPDINHLVSKAEIRGFGNNILEEMAANELERLKQILPKISAKLADKKERLIIKMKELQIFKDNVDIFQTLAESNNVEMLEYLKEILRIEGHVLIVRDIEGKSAQAGDYTENSTSSADNRSDSFCNDMESKSDPFCCELREMKQQMMKELQEMKNEIKETRAEAKEYNEQAKKRESKLLELISKLEQDKDEIQKKLEENSPAGIDEAAAQVLQAKFHDLETKYNQIVEQMKKMGKTELGLRERNKRLETEIAQLKLALLSMQVSKTAKGQMYTKLAAPTRQKKDK